MFLVVSIQNARDSTIPVVTPRFISKNFGECLKASRRVRLTPEEVPFVSQVVIYELEEEKEHSLRELVVRLNDKQKPIMVFLSSKDDLGNWHEQFYGRFFIETKSVE